MIDTVLPAVASQEESSNRTTRPNTRCATPEVEIDVQAATVTLETIQGPKYPTMKKSISPDEISMGTVSTQDMSPITPQLTHRLSIQISDSPSSASTSKSKNKIRSSRSSETRHELKRSRSKLIRSNSKSGGALTRFLHNHKMLPNSGSSSRSVSSNRSARTAKTASSRTTKSSTKTAKTAHLSKSNSEMHLMRSSSPKTEKTIQAELMTPRERESSVALPVGVSVPALPMADKKGSVVVSSENTKSSSVSARTRDASPSTRSRDAVIEAIMMESVSSRISESSSALSSTRSSRDLPPSRNSSRASMSKPSPSPRSEKPRIVSRKREMKKRDSSDNNKSGMPENSAASSVTSATGELTSSDDMSESHQSVFRGTTDMKPPPMSTIEDVPVGSIPPLEKHLGILTAAAERRRSGSRSASRSASRSRRTDGASVSSKATGTSASNNAVEEASLSTKKTRSASASSKKSGEAPVISKSTRGGASVSRRVRSQSPVISKAPEQSEEQGEDHARRNIGILAEPKPNPKSSVKEELSPSSIKRIMELSQELETMHEVGETQSKRSTLTLVSDRKMEQQRPSSDARKVSRNIQMEQQSTVESTPCFPSCQENQATTNKPRSKDSSKKIVKSKNGEKAPLLNARSKSQASNFSKRTFSWWQTGSSKTPSKTTGRSTNKKSKTKKKVRSKSKPSLLKASSTRSITSISSRQDASRVIDDLSRSGDFDEESSELNKDRLSKLEKIYQLKSKNGELKQHLDDLAGQLRSKEKRLQEVIYTSNVQISALHTEIRDVNVGLESLARKHSSANESRDAALKAMGDAATKLKDALEHKTTQNQNLQRELETIKARIWELEADRVKAEATIQSMSGEKALREQERERTLRSEMQKEEKLEETSQQLQDFLEKSQKQRVDSEVLRKNRELEVLQGQLDAARMELAMAQETSRGKSEELDRLGTELEEKEQQLEDVRGHYDASRKELADVRAESQKKSEEAERLGAQFLESSQKLQKLHEELRNARQEAAILGEGSKESMQTVTRLEAEGMEMTRQLEDLQESLDRSREESLFAREESRGKTQQLKQVRSEVVEISRQLEDLRDLLDSAQMEAAAVRKESEGKSAEIEQLRAEFHDKNRQLEELRVDYDEKLKSVAELEEELESLNARFAILEEEHVTELEELSIKYESDLMEARRKSEEKMSSAVAAVQNQQRKSSRGGLARFLSDDRSAASSTEEQVSRKEEVIKKLQSDLVSATAKYKDDRYRNQVEIEKLTQENAAYAIKVRALEEEFQRMKGFDAQEKEKNDCNESKTEQKTDSTTAQQDSDLSLEVEQLRKEKEAYEVMIANLSAEMLRMEQDSKATSDRISKELHFLRQENEAKELKVACLERAFQDDQSSCYQSEYTAEPSDMERIVMEREKEVKELQEAKKKHEETVDKLRSELIRMKVSMREQSHQSERKLQEFLMENEAKELKVAVMEQGFREANPDSEIVRRVVQAGNDNESGSIVSLDAAYLRSLEQQLEESRKSIDDLNQQIFNERAVAKRVEDELMAELQSVTQKSKSGYSINEEDEDDDEAEAEFWNEEDLLASGLKMEDLFNVKEDYAYEIGGDGKERMIYQ